MGDRLEDDDWVADNAHDESEDSDDVDDDVNEDVTHKSVDWVEEDSNDSDEEDEIETIASWKDQANKEAKLEKKKAKFAALKEKKRQPLPDELKQESVTTFGQWSTLTMISELAKNAPVPYRTSQQLAQTPFFVEEDFFYPSLPTTAVTESTTKRLCPFVRALSVSMPNYKKTLLTSSGSSSARGSPAIVIVTTSAVRATEIIKSVSSKLIKVKIGKLFAKHFKIQEQIEMLNKESFPVVIGTPNRIEKLIELGALSLKDTRVLLVDHTADAKSFSVLTLPEVKNDFYKLFYEYVFPEKAHLKIAFINDIAGEVKGSGPKDASKLMRKKRYGKHDNSQRQGFKPSEPEQPRNKKQKFDQ